MKKTMLFGMILLIVSALAYGLFASNIISKTGYLDYDGFRLTLSLDLTDSVDDRGESSVEDGRFIIRLWDDYYLGEKSFILYKRKKYMFNRNHRKLKGFYKSFVDLTINEIGFSSPPFQFEMDLILRDPSGKVKRIKKKISVTNGPERKNDRPYSIREIILKEV